MRGTKLLPACAGGRPGVRAARGSSLQAARGEREAQDPRKLDDGILKRVLKSSGMERGSVGNRFRLLGSAAEAGAGARAVAGARGLSPQSPARFARCGGMSRQGLSALLGVLVWAEILESTPTWLKRGSSSPQPPSLKLKKKRKQNS